MKMNAQKRASRDRILEVKDEIAYFPLPDLLPPGQVLAFSKRLSLLSCLSSAEMTTEKWPRLLAQEQFSQSEGRVLLPLLENFPHFCPYEALLANFSIGETTDETIGRYRLRLQEAQFAGVWDFEMRPVRNVLSRVRYKLRSFHIEVRSILETGYVLIPLEE